MDADLDLVLVDNSSGQVVETSASWDNSWEAIDWPVTVGQSYTLRIRKFSNWQNQTYAGIAWYNYQPGTE